MRPLRLAAMIVISVLYAGTAAGTEVVLFYTPAERARITAERSGMLVPEPGAVRSGSAGASDPVLASKTDVPRLEGVSLPAEGRAHAWIGGRRYQEGALFQGQRLHVTRNGVQLTDAGGSRRLYRVGEAIRGAASP